MKRRWAALAALALPLVLAAPAGATSSSHEALRYDSGTRCVYVKSGIDTANNGTNISRVRMRQDYTYITGNHYECSDTNYSQSYSVSPWGLELGFWNTAGGSICTYGYWYYNGGTTSSFQVQFTNARRCSYYGPTLYQTTTWGNWWNGAWLGTGDIGSGAPVYSGYVGM